MGTFVLYNSLPLKGAKYEEEKNYTIDQLFSPELCKTYCKMETKNYVPQAVTLNDHSASTGK